MNDDRVIQIFKCGFCDYSFCEKDSLKLHLLSVHGSRKSYQCEICGQVFSRSDHMQIHIKTASQNMKVSKLR